MRLIRFHSHLIKTVFPVILLLVPAVTLSQGTGTCAENLQNAQNLFDRGQVQEVPGILEDCMKSGFTREEQLSAYKLLIQSYIFGDKLDQADSTMMEFLHRNPEYDLSPTDHSSFVYLYNKFTVKPLMQVSIHLGTNLPFVTFVKEHHLVESVKYGKSNYSSKGLNFYGSLEAKYELSPRIEINLEAAYSQVKFTDVEDTYSLQDIVFGQKTYNETQQRIELPLTVTYDFKSFGRFTPYGRLGGGPVLNLSTTATAEWRPTDINNSIIHTGKDISRNGTRLSLDMFLQAGAGLKLKTRGGYIHFELRSNTGLLNQTIRGGDLTPEQTTAISDLRDLYYHEDDNFHLNTLNFVFGYTQIFYKASKREE